MREILFRGIDEVTNDWVYGHYFEKPSEFGGETRYYIFDSKTITRYSVIPETVGQYTGLTARGKKIFEGDYWIDEDNAIFVVEFRNGQYCFVIYGITGEMTPNGFDETAGCFGEVDCVPMTDYYVDDIEIAGNVHDNPELIKRG